VDEELNRRRIIGALGGEDVEGPSGAITLGELPVNSKTSKRSIRRRLSLFENGLQIGNTVEAELGIHITKH